MINWKHVCNLISDLEGDQLFGEIEPSPQPTQEAPLALTNKPPQQQSIQVEMNPFLQFRTTSSSVSQIHPHHSINNRPGVIVVKQNSWAVDRSTHSTTFQLGSSAAFYQNKRIIWPSAWALALQNSKLNINYNY